MFPKKSVTRNLSLQNLNILKDALTNQLWTKTLNSTDVNNSYSAFWNSFKQIYDTCIPLNSKEFNKNFNKISNHMTTGLLISRTIKLNLLKLSILTPTPENLTHSKTYHNLYNKLHRVSKKDYYTNNLKLAEKDPKKAGNY